MTNQNQNLNSEYHKRKSELEAEYLKKKYADKYPCPFCELKFRLKWTLMQHKQTVHHIRRKYKKDEAFELKIEGEQPQI